MVGYSMPSMAHMVSESQRRNSGSAGLFYSALAAGQSRTFWAALTRRPRGLRPLAAGAARGQGGHSAGRRLVEIADIRGSEGRTKDFDDQFHPLSGATRQRWQSVAAALDAGVRLPPVQLIQVGQDYYVRDGHHRISVARTLGQDAIEAEVTVWAKA